MFIVVLFVRAQVRFLFILPSRLFLYLQKLLKQREAQDEAIRKLKEQLEDYVKKVEEYEGKVGLFFRFCRCTVEVRLSSVTFQQACL